MSDPDDGLGSAWWPAPGDRGGMNTLPALAGDISGSFGSGSMLGARTTVTMAPGGPTQLPDGTVRLPPVTVKISRLTYVDYVHADSYALIGNLLNLLGVPVLGDLALADRAQLYGNLVDRNILLGSAVIGGALTVVPVGRTAGTAAARGGVGAIAGASRDATTVIGRLKDLQKLGPGEKSLLDRLPNLGSPRANWQQNSGVLRQQINRGLPIRDASPNDVTGVFLNAERNLLRSRGWVFDKQTNLWMPPKGGRP